MYQQQRGPSSEWQEGESKRAAVVPCPLPFSSALMTPAIASLGLFILDQFEWREYVDLPRSRWSLTPPRTGNPDGSLIKTAEELVVGGGGTYAMIGSRMWCVLSSWPCATAV